MTEAVIIALGFILTRFVLRPPKQYRLIAWTNFFIFIIVSYAFSKVTGSSLSGVDALKYYYSGNTVLISELSSFTQANFMYALSNLIQSILPVTYTAFNLIGALLFSHTALLLLMRKVPDKRTNLILLWWAITLLPGFHYWNASFGKDSLQLLLIGIYFMSSAQITRGVSLIVLMFVRPHIAIILVIANIIENLLKKGFSLKKLSTLVIGAIIMIYAVGILIDRVIGSEFEFESIILAFQDYGDNWETSNLRLNDTGTPLAIVEFLFRPYFWEIESTLVFISVFDNFIMVLLLILMLIKTQGWAKKQTPWVFTIILIIMLAFTNPNIGTATRKKQTFPYMTLVIAMLAFQTSRHKKDAHSQESS